MVLSALAARLGVPRSLVLMYINIALYALSFNTQGVAQPYLVKMLVKEGGAATAAFLQLKTVNGVAQMLGSLLSGFLLDAIGCRSVMLLSFGASLLSYGLMAVPSDSTWLLFLSQIPTLLQHAMLAAQFMVSVKAPPEQRSVLLGYLSVCYGVGVVVGPALGGALSGVSLRAPAAFAAACSVLSLIITVLDPETDTAAAAKLKAEAEVAAAKLADVGGGGGGGGGGGAPAAAEAPASSSLLAFVTEPVLASRFALKALFASSLALFYSVYQILALDRFGLDAGGAGMLTSFIGVVGVATQAGGLGALKARYSEHAILLGCAATLVAAFAAFAVISSSAELFALVVPLVVANTLFSTINTAQILQATERKGAAAAVNMAIFSGLRMLMPALGGALLQRAGFWSIGASSAAVSTVMLILMLLFPRSVMAGQLLPASPPAHAPAAAKPHAE